MVVSTFFGIAFLYDWNENSEKIFFQMCTYYTVLTFTMSQMNISV